MNEKMFCYQCQETAGCKGCTMVGVCGKQPDVAAMQDLLVYVSKGLSAVTTALRREGQTIPAGINHLITLNLFTTITNANFDRESIEARIRATLEARQEQLARLNRRDGLPEAALWDGSGDWEEKARTVGVLSTRDEDIRSLRELITYGLKGLSAYSKHANVLLQDDPEVDAFLQRALAATLDDSLTVQDLVNLTLETGKYGVAGMALLDKANTEAYGNPEITRVSLGVRGNPGILVSGHDLPIVYNIAWYEQKAVIVLLALLSLGIHNIHLGPTLPAFLSPNVTKVLVEQFGIAGIGSVEEDLRLLIGE